MSQKTLRRWGRGRIFKWQPIHPLREWHRRYNSFNISGFSVISGSSFLDLGLSSLRQQDLAAPHSAGRHNRSPGQSADQLARSILWAGGPWGLALHVRDVRPVDFSPPTIALNPRRHPLPMAPKTFRTPTYPQILIVDPG